VKIVKYWLSVMLLSVLAACGGGGGSDAPPGPSPIVKVDAVVEKGPSPDFPTHIPKNIRYESGELQTNTGIWGISAASAYHEHMTGTIDPNTNTANILVNWDITASDTPGVVAFPNITYGLHPGEPKGTTSKLPAKISSMRSYVVTADVNTSCSTSCIASTAFDMFVMKSDRVQNADIGTEILVVTERIGWGDPKEIPDDEVTIEGVPFKVYHHLPASPTNPTGPKWNIIQYYVDADKPVHAVNFDVKKFMDDAVKRDWISPDEYLVSIEYGSEVASGKGTTDIKNFRVN